MFEWIVTGILALGAAGAAASLIYMRKIKKEGVEAEAVICRILAFEDEDGGTDYSVYVLYRNVYEEEVEAQLANPEKELYEGDKLLIRYMKETPKYAVMVRRI